MAMCTVKSSHLTQYQSEPELEANYRKSLAVLILGP